MEGQQSRKVYPTQGMGAIWRRMFPYKHYRLDMDGAISGLSGSVSHAGSAGGANADSYNLILLGAGAPADPPFPETPVTVSQAGTTTALIANAPLANSWAVRYDSSAGNYLDDRANANTAGAGNEMLLVDAPPSMDDAYLFGDDNEFDCVAIIMATSNAMTSDEVLELEYSKAAGAWGTLGTVWFTKLNGEDSINDSDVHSWIATSQTWIWWKRPADWATHNLALGGGGNTGDKYWIRIRASSVGGAGFVSAEGDLAYISAY